MAVTDICRDIEKLTTEMKAKLIQHLNLLQAEGITNFYVFETYRTQERQTYLFNKGASKLRTSGKHGQRKAYDLVAKDANGKWSWDEKKFPYKRVAEIGKSIGLTPGYYWPRFHDGAHFQI